jgi:hypothetical protein
MTTQQIAEMERINAFQIKMGAPVSVLIRSAKWTEDGLLEMTHQDENGVEIISIANSDFWTNWLNIADRKE